MAQNKLGIWNPFCDDQRLYKKSIQKCFEKISFYTVRMVAPPTFCYPFSEVAIGVTCYERRKSKTVRLKQAKMFAFKDLFPRAFALFTEDVKLNKSEKKLLQKLWSCQQDMETIQDFFKKPVGLKRKAPGTSKASVGEKEMNVLLVSNVLKKVIDADIVMNTAHPKPTNPPDPSIKYPDEAKMAGLYIGNSKAWYGELDMVIVPEKGLTSDVGNVVAVTGAPEDTEAENPDSSPGEKVPVEGKVGHANNDSVIGSTKSLSQSYAIAVTFSHVYHLRHSKRTFFPSIQISPNWFKVFLYDVQQDVMLAQSFNWSSGSFLVLWAVVNYYHFLRYQIPEECMRFVGSHGQAVDYQGFEEADILHYMEAKGNVIDYESCSIYGALTPTFDDFEV